MPKPKKHAKSGKLDEARAVEEGRFCYELAIRGVTYAEIRQAAEKHFDRATFSDSTISRRVAAERERRMVVTPKERETARHDVKEQLASLRLKAEQLLNAKKVVFDMTGQAEPAFVDDLDLVAKGITVYGRLIEIEAKIFGLNAPEKVEATVVHLTPEDPAIQARIAEARARRELRERTDPPE